MKYNVRLNTEGHTCGADRVTCEGIEAQTEDEAIMIACTAYNVLNNAVIWVRSAEMKTPKLSFTEACAMYVHRFTMEHVPAWARTPMNDGAYYAPQYRSDREWYDNTEFPPHRFTMSKKDKSCYSAGQTWPLGKSLTQPYTR